jgi:hypothetical protein
VDMSRRESSSGASSLRGIVCSSNAASALTTSVGDEEGGRCEVGIIVNESSAFASASSSGPVRADAYDWASLVLELGLGLSIVERGEMRRSERATISTDSLKARG